jgi:hypothetical protein
MELALACALFSYVLTAPAGDARAQGAVRLETVGPLPFTATELAEVVSARLSLAQRPDATPARVGPAGPGGIDLQVAQRRSRVDVGTRTGVVAARLVALALVDLMTRESAPAPVPAPAPASRLAASAPAPRETNQRATPLRTSLAFDVSRGLAREEPIAYGFTADALSDRGRLALGVGLGVSAAPAQHEGRADEASFHAASARFWGGVGGGRFDAVLGPFIAGYQLGGPLARSGVLAGAGAMLRMRQALGARSWLTASIRADGFANRFRVSVGDASPSFATPRVALALAVGLAWDRMP